MLRILRKRQKSLLIIFIGLISIVFVFWGFHGSFTKRFLAKNDIASVNGEKITAQEYQAEYQNLTRLYQNVLKDKFTEEMANRFNLKQLALNQLIDQKLMVQGAKELNLSISDEQIRDQVIQAPYFQKNGKFDKDYYIQLLKANHLTPTHYEDSIRLDLLQRQVADLLKTHIKISDEEALKSYQLKNDKVNLEFIRIDPSSQVSRINVTPEEIKDFLTQKENLEKAQNYYTVNNHLFKSKDIKGVETQKLFENVKEDISKTLLQDQKSQDLAKNLVESLWKDHQNSALFNKALSQEKLKWEETGLFSRESRFVPKIGDSKEIFQTAFKLKENMFANRTFSVHNQSFIVRLKKHDAVDSNKFSGKEKDTFTQQMLTQRQSEAYYEWLKELKSKATIVISKASDQQEEE